MGEQVHRFGNLIFDLEVYASQSGYHKALDKARDLYMQQVLPAIETVLNELCPPELVVELDKLEIDLGDVSASNWEDEFVARCVEKFAAKLREKLGTVQTGNAHSPDLTVKSPAVWRPELMVRYLERGSFGAAATSLPSARELLEELLAEHSDDLLGGLAASPELQMIARRLVYQFPVDIVERLRSQLMADLGHQGHFSLWISELRGLASKAGLADISVVRSLRVTEMWLLLEGLGIKRGSRRRDQEVLRQHLRMLGIEEEIGAQEDVQVEVGGELDMVLRFLMEMGAAIPSKRKKAKRDLAHPAMRTKIEVAFEVVWNAIQHKGNQQETPHSKSKKKTPEVSADMLNTKRLGTDDAMSVAHAGIVLLNPFLQEFFELNGLVMDGEFQGEAAQYRGVYLLHYMATFSEEAEEGDLALLKLLCGLRITAPIFLEEPLREAEKLAAWELLAAVIEYWPSMKDSSPEALQEAFLQRTGTLEQGGTGYRLRIETFMLDLLLAKLPWGLSIVHYPWMEGLLYVEWG